MIARLKSNNEYDPENRLKGNYKRIRNHLMPGKSPCSVDKIDIPDYIDITPQERHINPQQNEAQQQLNLDNKCFIKINNMPTENPQHSKNHI